MLRRKDLAKEFELVVQQEIKNHNDSILATNIALEKIRKRLDEHEEILKKSIASIQSDVVSRQQLIDYKDKEVTKRCDEYQRSINDLKANLMSSDTVNEKRFTRAEMRISCNPLIDDLKKEVAELRQQSLKMFIDLKLALKSGLDYVASKGKKECEKVAEEAKSRPSHIENIKKELLQKITEQNIDKNCLIDEIKGCKKAHFIHEKKIENLYTLNQRLKAKMTEIQGDDK